MNTEVEDKELSPVNHGTEKGKNGFYYGLTNNMEPLVKVYGKTDNTANPKPAVTELPEVSYRFERLGLKLSDREIVFCLLIAMVSSVCLDGFNSANTKLFGVIALGWWLPIVTALAVVVVITQLHRAYPGCLFVKISKLSQEHKDKDHYQI